MTTAPRTLLHVFSTFKVGGPQIRFCQLANHFGRDYRHLIVSMDGATQAAGMLAHGLDTRILDVPVRKGDTWENLRTFRRVIGVVRPDLLVTSNWGCIEWAMANLVGGVPHLHMEDGFGPEEARGQIPRRVWTRRLVLWRSTVLLPSKTLHDLASTVWRLPGARLVYVPNGVDCGRFGGAPDRQFAAAHGLGPGDPIIGTVAALRAEKNLVRLVEAFAQANQQHPARLAIVGDGPERERIAARAQSLGVADRVILTGACPTPERLLSAMAIFAMSSDTEQMPLSLLEAMATGLPVAATNVGDVGLMLGPDSASVVVDKDADHLAGAMIRILSDSKMASELGSINARRAREIYDQSLMFKAYRTLFDGRRLDG